MPNKSDHSYLIFCIFSRKRDKHAGQKSVFTAFAGQKSIFTCSQTPQESKKTPLLKSSGAVVGANTACKSQGQLCLDI